MLTDGDNRRPSRCCGHCEPLLAELSKASNNSPRGLWSDGNVMYVADESDDRVYRYNMPDAIDARLASLTLSGVESERRRASRRASAAPLCRSGYSAISPRARIRSHKTRTCRGRLAPAPPPWM